MSSPRPPSLFRGNPSFFTAYIFVFAYYVLFVGEKKQSCTLDFFLLILTGIRLFTLLIWTPKFLSCIVKTKIFFDKIENYSYIVQRWWDPSLVMEDLMMRFNVLKVMRFRLCLVKEDTSKIVKMLSKIVLKPFSLFYLVFYSTKQSLNVRKVISWEEGL